MGKSELKIIDWEYADYRIERFDEFTLLCQARSNPPFTDCSFLSSFERAQFVCISFLILLFLKEIQPRYVSQPLKGFSNYLEGVQRIVNDRLVVVNQTVGPFYFEFLSELVRLDKFSDIVLITGSSDQQLLMEFTELGIVIDRGIEYQKSNPILRVGTWLLFSLAVLVKVLISQCPVRVENHIGFFVAIHLLAPLLGLIRR